MDVERDTGAPAEHDQRQDRQDDGGQDEEGERAGSKTAAERQAGERQSKGGPTRQRQYRDQWRGETSSLRQKPLGEEERDRAENNEEEGGLPELAQAANR